MATKAEVFEVTAGDGMTTVDLEKVAKPVLDQVVENLTRQTEKYTQHQINQAKKRAVNDRAEIAEPITDPFAGPYPYWNLLMVGPFQPGPVPGGPYLPHKIIRAGESAFMIGVIWRNPAPVNWFPPGPSAAVLTAAFNFSVRFETMNLTTVTNGPDFGPFNFAPIGMNPITAFVVPISFPAPPDGRPDLYEINMVADVTGPVAGLPFAGFATWHVDPDHEPPFLLVPSAAPALQHDIPARLLVYKA
jgi:hypothetical protein